MALIAPSFLSADFLNLQKDVDFMNAYADIFHMDVMDGVFVPNISFGFPVIEAVGRVAEKPLDVHLMVVNPEKYALKFAQIKGVGMVSFHIEAQPDPIELLKELKETGVKAGIVANPDFPVENLFSFLEYCDYVLIMSVFAGFAGQKFIENTFLRVKKLKDEILRRGLKVQIEVDGGVSVSNAAKLSECGADLLVAGTSVFKADNPAAAIAAMR